MTPGGWEQAPRRGTAHAALTQHPRSASPSTPSTHRRPPPPPTIASTMGVDANTVLTAVAKMAHAASSRLQTAARMRCAAAAPAAARPSPSGGGGGVGHACNQAGWGCEPCY